ncbi:class I SAM-dependent methyltransferase [Dactylosporangium matsuzakiense]|uniref:Methyltransferase n=1 Tax=Dactylosporangium matsuzakiense TaxID=53360 RepID=A0A9W6NJA0_9ACTN|nr:putative methyltransferase [Dactylosporangium matsuzakiense]
MSVALLCVITNIATPENAPRRTVGGVDFSKHASSFGAAADLYDRIRPRYPLDALRWAVGEPSRRIVDLGAGTGILTRQLRELGHRVIAVEPDDEMRRQIDGDARAGSATDIPVDAESQEVVTAGQAYHWFAGEPAHTEIARVLERGGCFVPIWNVRDESVPWVAALTEVFDGNRARAAIDERSLPAEQFGPLFDTPELKLFSWSTPHTIDSLVELIRSRSFYLVADADTRVALEQQVRELAGRTFGAQERFELPYVTYAYRTRKL